MAVNARVSGQVKKMVEAYSNGGKAAYEAEKEVYWKVTGRDLLDEELVADAEEYLKD